MGKAREFENILDECLDRVIKGEAIDLCLARHPEHAAELEPLLRTALETKMAAAIKPRPEFRQRAGNEFQAAIRDMPSKGHRSPFKWQLRWVVPVAIMVVLLMAGTGTVFAATNSLPDSPLYQVKLATEAVQLVFTPSAEGKAELYARFVDYRVEEIVKMAEKGDVDQIEKVTERMNSQLLAVATLELNGGTLAEEKGMLALQAPPSTTNETASNAVPFMRTVPTTTIIVTQPPATTPAPPATDTQGFPEFSSGQADNAQGNNNKPDDKEKLKTILLKKAAQNLQILKVQLEKAPKALKPALLKAIEVAEQGYAQALANLE
jgi:uncharacterized protein YggL (DUF469 family)